MAEKDSPSIGWVSFPFMFRPMTDAERAAKNAAKGGDQKKSAQDAGRKRGKRHPQAAREL